MLLNSVFACISSLYVLIVYGHITPSDQICGNPNWESVCLSKCYWVAQIFEVKNPTLGISVCIPNIPLHMIFAYFPTQKARTVIFSETLSSFRDHACSKCPKQWPVESLKTLRSDVIQAIGRVGLDGESWLSMSIYRPIQVWMIWLIHYIGTLLASCFFWAFFALETFKKSRGTTSERGQAQKRRSKQVRQ